ncbi:MAG TPA: hypothetical protein VGC91_01625 [Pyrinomonadaceae bacterium]|jgi:hypothetical protein
MSKNAADNHLSVQIGSGADMQLELGNTGDTTITYIDIPDIEIWLDKDVHQRTEDVRAQIRFDTVHSTLPPGGRVAVKHTTYFWDDRKNDWITDDDITTHNDMLIHLKDGERRESYEVAISFTDDEGTKRQTVMMGKGSGL